MVIGYKNIYNLPLGIHVVVQYTSFKFVKLMKQLNSGAYTCCTESVQGSVTYILKKNIKKTKCCTDSVQGSVTYILKNILKKQNVRPF